ncbi:MAG: glycogen synthase GlgA [Candidatus Solibacter usitatus]|nr:glycogen synthase GlgA [Candidatus Solibacter usitatus]
MVASEATPFCKTGGLADVLGALPPALAAMGDDVAVVLPRYRGVKLAGARLVLEGLPLWIGPGRYTAGIYEVVRDGVSYFLVECPTFFDRDGIYGYSGGEHWDNHSRFAALCHAAIGVARKLFRPDIFHCHDWQAGLLPVYLKHFLHSDHTFQKTRTVFTIHNMGYQGRYGRDQLFWLGLPDTMFRPDLLEFHGEINLLKGGILFSDAITTVSPTYAKEIQTVEHGFGLDGLLRARGASLTGILNGVDYKTWSPETDPHIAAPFTSENLQGKRECKLDLLRYAGLPTDRPEVPLIGIVSRMAAQKGFDLIAAIAADLVHWDIRMTVLGSGESVYEDVFRGLAAACPEKFSISNNYDDALAHKIEAGADMFLMPSRYEPCGLNQMYSLRYGTVPIVHATGGLDDTIDANTGFKFSPYSPEAMLGAMRDALNMYWKEPQRWKALMVEGMGRDHSWGSSAAAYRRLYKSIAG